MENIDGFKKWIKNNPAVIKYPTKQPQFIPLPHSQQIKLRTFANKTNISFLTEIEGTIKAQVPKSLGATVNTHTEQINNLNKELDRVKKLEESTVSTVTTESDFTTVEATSNGYFEDVKLEGKTLVNLWDINKMNLQNSDAFDTVDNATRKNGDWIEVKTSGVSWITPACKIVSVIKPSTLYTVIFEIKDSTYSNDKKVSSNIQFQDTNGNKPESCFDTQKDIYLVNGVNIFTLKSRADVDGARYSLRTQFQPSFVGEGSCKFRVTLLEGDHTQNPPSYFEGLKSVGQDVDEISVESVDGDGNLVEYIELNGVNSGDGGNYTDSKYVRTNYITVEPNQTYYIKPSTNVLYINYVVYFYESNKSCLGYKSGLTSEFTTVANTKFIRIDMKKADNTSNTQEDIDNCDFVVSKCRVTEYVPRLSDKKRLLYYNEETQTWEKPIIK